MIPKNIIFYFPSNTGAHGVNILFLSLANYFANNTEYNIFIGDYENGYMVTQNKNPKVRELYIIKNQVIDIPHDSIVIIQTVAPWHIENELNFHNDTKILFWNLFPYNLLHYFRDYRSNIPSLIKLGAAYPQFLMKMFVTILVEKNGIIFAMAEERRSAETVLDKKLEIPFYVPVFSDDPRKKTFKFNHQFAWIGRLADFKISILTHTIEKLSEYSKKEKYKIVFYVIGDGPDKSDVEYKASLCENEYFEVVFKGEVEHTQIEQFLTKTVCVLFAMGTSALEGGRLGLPTILLDFSYYPIGGDYKFKYLFETEEYSTGDEVGTLEYKGGYHSLDSIIDELRDENKYEKVGTLCYQYYQEHHDIKFVFKRLIDAIDRCDLRYEAIKSLRHNPIMKMFKAARKWMRDLKSTN